MKTLVCSSFVVFAVTIGSAQTINFDAAPPGASAPGWTAAITGKGESKWTVEKDSTAPSAPNVMKQSGEGTYPICLKDQTKIRDGFVEVKFKPIAGKEDQAGGVIWRAQDKGNYYVARANALEDNVTIYHTINGKRVSFKNANMKVAPNQWHTLRVVFVGNHFTVALDGKQVITATDDSFKTAGQLGLWTKADSVTLFDDFQYGAQ